MNATTTIPLLINGGLFVFVVTLAVCVIRPRDKQQEPTNESETS